MACIVHGRMKEGKGERGEEGKKVGRLGGRGEGKIGSVYGTGRELKLIEDEEEEEKMSRRKRRVGRRKGKLVRVKEGIGKMEGKKKYRKG